MRPARAYRHPSGPDDEDVTRRIGFAGAAAMLFAATHATLAIAAREIDSALVCHRDSADRSMAVVLSAV
jgi:hypothetical protein